MAKWKPEGHVFDEFVERHLDQAQKEESSSLINAGNSTIRLQIEEGLSSKQEIGS